MAHGLNMESASGSGAAVGTWAAGAWSQSRKRFHLSASEARSEFGDEDVRTRLLPTSAAGRLWLQAREPGFGNL